MMADNEMMSDKQLAELEAKDVINLPLHVCGRAYPQLAAYNYGREDGPVDYRVACHGCRMQTFPFETPQEAYAAWQKHLALTDANEVGRLRAENATMREIVEAVASSNPYGSWYPTTDSSAGVVCRWCMKRAYSPAQFQHDHECTWRQARTLLGTYEQRQES